MSRDQLEQSREAAEREARAQAERITFWTEFVGEGRDMGKLHVLNRSLDPMNSGWLFVAEVGSPDDSDGQFGLVIAPGKRAHLAIGVIPPCTERIIKVAELQAYTPEWNHSKTDLKPLIANTDKLVFRDRSGQAWTRNDISLRHGGKFPKFPVKGNEISFSPRRPAEFDRAVRLCR
ncbi:hypothetical protein OHA02_52435 [Streptomyces phaeochromogenes]|nr:hypothetical protein [Streptomyces phaeochromogenes]